MLNLNTVKVVILIINIPSKYTIKFSNKMRATPFFFYSLMFLDVVVWLVNAIERGKHTIQGGDTWDAPPPRHLSFVELRVHCTF